MKELDIFSAAWDMADPDARAKYLNEACGEDSELRERIEALLRNAAHASRFLESPPAPEGMTVAAPITERAGDSIGPYKLLEQIGEGGMGVVYMAEQTEPVERRVALKIIKPGMDTQQVIARFEGERQALAMMDHPNIARVLDAGATDTGRPYFVMELVKGVPITQYCDEQHLTLRERLELFVPICQAIQHAHQKGIIHRDVKPTNILVARYDGRPVPKAIDFGVAKATGRQLTDKTMFTQYGQIVGTIEYMSPEQAEFNQADIDTRSDVYSLGVLLYELLTGETPFDRQSLRSAAFDELLRIIREEEPPRPSTRLSSSQTLPSIAANRNTEPKKLGTLVRGELDWIVMKALEKDRARRYDTASKFAEDVQHYLNDEPVEACPPSASYRLRKFVRRNRAALAAGAVVAAALLVGAGLAVWQGMRAARAEAVTARQSVEVNRRISEVVGELQAAIAKAKSAPAGDTEAWAEAREAAERARTLAEQELADGELVNRVAALAAEIDQEQRDRKLIARLEGIRLLQTETDTAASRFQRRMALPEYEKLFAEQGLDPRRVTPRQAAARVAGRSPEVAAALVAALDDWLDILRLHVQEPSAEHARLREQVAALVDAVDTDAWRKRMRAAGEAKDYKLLLQLAGSDEALQQPPGSLAMLGSALCAEQEHWKTGIALLQRAQCEDPSDFWINNALGRAFETARPPQYDEAVRYFAAAVACRPDTPGARLNLGNALRKDGKLEQAVAEYQRAIALAPKYAAAHNSLGALLCDDLQRWPEAEAIFRRAIELDPNSSKAHANLGTALSNQLQSAEAVAEYRKAVELDPDNADAHSNLGLELQRQGKQEEALEELRRAVDLEPENPMCRAALGDTLRLQQNWADAVEELRRAVELDPEDANAHHCLGLALFGHGEIDEAAAEFREAIRLDPDQAGWHECLGEALAAEGKLDEAITKYREAILLDAEVAGGRLNLGIALEKQGKYEEALDVYREEIARHPEDAHGHHNLGVCLSRLGRPQEAMAALREALRRDPGLFESHHNLGILLGRMGDPKGAMEAYREAIRLKPGDPRPHYNLGHALLEAGRFEAALLEFREAIQLNPQDADSHASMGAALYKLGRFPEAIGAYRKAMELNPDDEANCRVSIGRALQGLQKWNEAAAEFRQAIGIQPTLAEAHDGLAGTLCLQGKLDEAVECYRTVLRLRPNDANVHNSLGIALSDKGRFQDAIEFYQTAIRLDPKNASPRNNLGCAYYKLRKWTEAEAAYREAIRIKPDYPEAQYGLGAVLNEQKRYAEAEAQFREAIRIKPDSAAAHNGLGVALYGAAGKSPLGHPVLENKLDEAVDCYRKAIDLGPHTAFFHANLGEALYRQGKWDETISAFREAVELRPGETMYRQWLGWALYQRGDWRASIESLEKSCQLQRGGKGDAGQWAVMALAHWKLAEDEELAQEDRARHREEARRLYDQSDRQIQRWSKNSRRGLRDISKFHAEGRKLMAAPVDAPEPMTNK